MKRVFAIAVVTDFCLAVLLLHAHIKDFLWTHPWWHSFLAALPGIAAPILAYMDVRHSVEANGLRTEANVLQRKIADLTKELDTERNKHLQQIAANIRQPQSLAERNAERLRKYLRKRTTVSEGNGSWGAGGAEIVEINQDNILTLFVPAGYASSSAYAVSVRCDELEVIEEPVGGCAVQLRILKRYGDTRQLGQIRNWDERGGAPPQPLPRGANAYRADYNKPGSPTRRGIYVFAPTDGNPQYTLVTLEDGRETGIMYDNNVEISKKFAVIQVQYRAEGFSCAGSASGVSPDPLYICTL